MSIIALFFAILTSTILCLAPCSSLAEDAAPDKEATDTVYSLGNVVVTATRTEIDTDVAPANVSVVTPEQLDSTTYNTLDEAIKYQAGVYDGKLRGLSSASQTLIMYNGMPLNSGWFGGPRWDNIPMENVEQIEIVRGPGSALYGGNAMGGAINIITAMPEKFEAGIKSRAGSDDNLSYGGHVGDKITDRFSARLGFEVDQQVAGYPDSYVQRTLSKGAGTLNGGFFMKTYEDKDAWIVGDLGDRDESQWNVDLAAKYDLTDSGSLRFDGQIGGYDYDYDAPHSYVRDAAGNPVFSGKVATGANTYASFSAANFLTGRGDLENGSYMLTYTDKFGGLDFVGKAGYQREFYWYTTPTAASGQTYYNAAGNIKEFTTNVYFTDLQGSFPIGERNRVTTGVYGRINDFDQGQYDLGYYRDKNSKTSGKTDLTQGKDCTLAAYAQDEWDIVRNKLTLYAGARFDYWQSSDGLSGDADNPTSLDDHSDYAFNPKVSLVWTPLADTVVKGSVGHAFRAPTLYDLYRTYESSTGMVYSNPELDPETLWNYEIGFIQYFWERRLKLETTLFYSQIKDLMYRYSQGNDSYIDNVGQAEIRGIELGASISPWKWLTLWTNYTYNDSEITKQSEDPEMEGKRITSMPDCTVNTGLNVNYEWLRAALTGQYTGRIYKSAYNTDIDDVWKANSRTWLWEAKVAAVLPVKSKYLQGAELSFSVKNLFDEEYYDYYVGRDRSYFVELKMNW
jgi:iron complex outermembrane receptor protein